MRGGDKDKERTRVARVVWVVLKDLLDNKCSRNKDIGLTARHITELTSVNRPL